jgi:hypothetical protein
MIAILAKSVIFAEDVFLEQRRRSGEEVSDL